MTEHTIPANAEGLPALTIANRALDAISLEAHSAHVIADIAAEVFDNLARDDAPDKNGFIVYRIAKNQVDQIDFLLNEQVKRTQALCESTGVAVRTVKNILVGGAA